MINVNFISKVNFHIAIEKLVELVPFRHRDEDCFRFSFKFIFNTKLILINFSKFY